MSATAKLLVGEFVLLSAMACLSPADTNSRPAASAGNTAITPEEFQQPKSLVELLALETNQLEKVDLARINLLCAEGLRGSENLDIQQCLETLDAWARYIDRETKRNNHHFVERPKEFNNSLAYYRMGMLGTVLAEDLRIRYSPKLEQQQRIRPPDSQTVADWNAFFTDSRDIFLHGLLSGRRSGTCSSMPFLHAAIGRRLGYPVTIAARKYHLYVRYQEGRGKHLNVEATENLGFSTPSDEEYRTGMFAMTEEEIKGCGWLRPFSNKKILGICLLNRANCLRSMKQHGEEIKTLEQAARYLPATPLMKRAIRKSQDLARDLQSEDRWDELWTKVEALQLPTGGPRFEYFQNRKLQVQFFMNQSTNLVEIEKSVIALEGELTQYRRDISDNVSELAEAFRLGTPPVDQRKFLAMLQDVSPLRRILIPQNEVPPEYWNGIPPELQARLNGLRNEEEVVAEMWAYHAGEISRRNRDARAASLPKPPALRPEQLPASVKATLPAEYRQTIPSPLAERLVGKSEREMVGEISKYYAEELRQKARAMLPQSQISLIPGRPDLQFPERPPLEIVIVPTSVENRTATNNLSLRLTAPVESEIRPTTNEKGSP
jgi:hypothetical protein